MRIITLHCDHVEFAATRKALKSAEQPKESETSMDECLLVLCASQKSDEGKEEIIGTKTAAEIEDVAKKVKADKIVLYPYVHLVSDPGSPDSARKIITETEKILKKNFSVVTAPFGWYKSFTFKCKGHPLSELSREIHAYAGGSGEKLIETESESLRTETEVRPEWFILNNKGKLIPAQEFDFKDNENLKKLWKYEVSKIRGTASEPPHAKLMKQLELVDYESGSDPGNMKFYPKGRLMKRLLETWITDKVVDYGGMEVETPVMYDYEHPALKSYLQRFPARQYTVDSAKKKFFLRFSACFGQFLMLANAQISYKDLPLRIYELTRYSFRLEKAGELVALRRLRAFTMPDLHTLCADMNTAKKEFQKQFRFSMDCLKDIGFAPKEYETAVRFTKSFLEENPDFAKELGKVFGRSCLIEVWNKRYAYFDPKFEFNFVDSTDKAAALSTVQIDHENSERFSIGYIDKDGKKKHPLILHCSPSGAIERCMYALLEKAAMDEKAGKLPSLPLWLTPTQVRLCPVSDEYIKDCENLAEKIHDIRVDIDDRQESVQKKVRDAELEWIPYIIIYGEKEKKMKGKVSVRSREKSMPKKPHIGNISIAELEKEIHAKTKGMPFAALPLPVMLGKRPIFYGR